MPDRPEVTWIPVGKLGEVRTGKQLSPTAANHPDQSPYLRVANVFEDRIDYSDIKTMHFSAHEKEVFGLRSGDILLNEGQSLDLVGRSALYTGPTGTNCFQNTLVRFRASEILDPAFAQYVFTTWLRRGSFARIARQTTSIAHLGADRFAAMPFPWIPLAEQRSIVSKIAELNEAIKAARDAVQQLIGLREAVSAQLLGRLDHGLKPLSDVLIDIEAGRSPRLEDTPARADQWGVLKISAVVPSGLAEAENKAVTDPRHINPRFEVRDGDLLMTRANTPDLVGMACIVQNPRPHLMLCDKTLRLRIDARKADQRYVLLALQSPEMRKQMRAVSTGTSDSMRNLSQPAIGALLHRWPSLEFQDKVVGSVAAVDDAVRAARDEVAKLTAFKQAVTDALLPHPVSVHALEEPVIIEA